VVAKESSLTRAMSHAAVHYLHQHQQPRSPAGIQQLKIDRFLATEQNRFGRQKYGIALQKLPFLFLFTIVTTNES